jgi:RHS repeat-associated protein
MKASSGADLERVKYGYDRASNRVWRNNSVANGLSAKQDEYYTYDELNQLQTLQRGTLNEAQTGIHGTPTWEEDLSFDPTGNWTNYVNKVNGVVNESQERTHNPANELRKINGSGNLVGYDGAGNMVRSPRVDDASKANKLTYDGWNRLVQVRKANNSVVATYGYDGQNRRTLKVTGTTTRHYYYSSSWQVLEERLNAKKVADRQYVWGLLGLDNLVLRDRGSERFYSLQDVFSCTAIADITGTIQERYGYDAFGLSRVMDADFNVLPASNYDWETRYDNYRFDSESNFYQVRNRYLHATLGRWITRDPLDYQDNINLYAYVMNRSVNSVDYFGLLTASGGTLHVSDNEHHNYLIFQLKCDNGYKVANITVNYDKIAMYHGLWTEFEQGPDAKDFSSEAAYTTHVKAILHDTFGGQVPPTPVGKCDGRSVEERAYMRTRLVSSGYAVTFYRIGAQLPYDISATQQLYVANTTIGYDCCKCGS